MSFLIETSLIILTLYQVKILHNINYNYLHILISLPYEPLYMCIRACLLCMWANLTILCYHTSRNYSLYSLILYRHCNDIHAAQTIA